MVAPAAEMQFNRDIRPILSDRCFSCHGPDKGNRKTRMRLDVESESRSAIVPGSPENSAVYKRITSTSKTLRMPPEYLGHERLNDEEVERIRLWIAQGAKYEAHWSFIPPNRPALPEVSDREWPKNQIDYFVLRRLEQEGLRPSGEADRRTLIRRVNLDLTGLPPSPDEVDAFLNDNSPTAWERVVDRLLASSRYAERMAIRWLEAARYADTNGYQTDGPRSMWRWRDWVIDAFQRDMPYDQFTIEQLAGDLLPNATRSQQIATGFNRNHRTSAEGGIVDEEFRTEYVADRTETTSTVWLGLTTGCARCHDHKFDPITQKDYYSMFAFFNNVPEKGFVWNFGNEEPHIKAPLPEQEKRLTELDRAVAEARDAVSRLQPAAEQAQKRWEKELASSPKPLEWAVTDGLKLTGNGKTFVGRAGTPKLDYRDPFTFAARVKPETEKGAILSKGEDYFEGQQHALYIFEGKLRLHVTFRWTDLALRVESLKPLTLNSWQHVAVTYDGGMKAAGVRMYVNGAEQEMKVLFDQLIWPMDAKQPWRIGAGGGLRFKGEIADVRVYSRALAASEVSTLPIAASLNEIVRIPASDRTEAQKDKLRLAFLEKFAPPAVLKARADLDKALRKRDAYNETIPTVMVMKERAQPRETFVHKRGAYDAPGEKVEASVPAFLAQLEAGWPRNRLGLAKWIVDRRNPLTARATVNRFWAMLFGNGLVKTAEDFGSQGEWPKNQELLDWMAVEFLDRGQSVKQILKTMVMSATYRQSSKMTPDLLQRDPENRLLARGPRARLSAEMIRDQALAASGLLVEKMGGPSVKPYQPAGLWQELQSAGTVYKEDAGEGLYRRSLYTFWRRTVAPPNMANFDSPTRETCVIRESRTNTPMQALNLMNDVVYVEASRKLAERMISEGGDTVAGRLDRAFLLVLARPARESERDSLRRALARFDKYYRVNGKDAQSLVHQGKSPVRTGLNTAELAAYTGVAGVILNLDQAITKE
ncbi:MAG: DUF1553 domain-containing protein [Bryobacteraceae bacterium]|nr:DUF1553 domain-containing protein [Bryobacteraceae bacterium]